MAKKKDEATARFQNFRNHNQTLAPKNNIHKNSEEDISFTYSSKEETQITCFLNSRIPLSYQKGQLRKKEDIDKLSSFIFTQNLNASDEDSVSDTHTYTNGELSESFSIGIKEYANDKAKQAKASQFLKNQPHYDSDYSYDPSQGGQDEIKLPPKPDGKFLRRTSKNYEVIQRFVNKRKKGLKKQKSVRINNLVSVHSPNDVFLAIDPKEDGIKRSSTRFNNTNIGIIQNNSFFNNHNKSGMSGLSKQKSILKKPSKFVSPKNYDSFFQIESDREQKLSQTPDIALNRDVANIEVKGLESFVKEKMHLKPQPEQNETDSLPSYVSETAIREDMDISDPTQSRFMENSKFEEQNVSFSKIDSLNHEITQQTQGNSPLDFSSIPTKISGLPTKLNKNKSEKKKTPLKTLAVNKSLNKMLSKTMVKQDSLKSKKSQESKKEQTAESNKLNPQLTQMSSIRRAKKKRRGAFRAVAILAKGKKDLSTIGTAPSKNILDSAQNIRPSSELEETKCREGLGARKKLGPAPIIDIDEEIFRDKERRAQDSMKKIKVLRNRGLDEYKRAANPHQKEFRNEVDIYDYSKPFVSLNNKIAKINLNSFESRNFRSQFNPLIFGSEFYFTEKSLKMHKPAQYPFLKYTFDSNNRNSLAISRLGLSQQDIANVLAPIENSKIHKNYLSNIQ
ncbi:unnamed protein product [Moneuplotes crassus]|uniref:Uncharacterized protein n=1 Tax=Euplotes crassus TaxID=5936 RepID=A0AAD1X189_EUPCR|nr:unnamed protein product [Moneuplotes crassus]